MTERAELTQLAEVLRFRRPPVWDPVEFLLRDRLDTVAMAKLAVAHLQLQRTVLEAQIKATEQALEIVRPLMR